MFIVIYNKNIILFLVFLIYVDHNITNILY